MSIMAPYVDGKLQTSTTSSDSVAHAKAGGNVVSSDTFLTLLVAEMQNQDPLEPTNNTEWVSQYATFTQVEQMGEMADSLNVMRANSLVGKEVIMKVTSEKTGETSYKRGVVDYIVMENGKALLNIGGANYSIDDLDTVASSDYFENYDFYDEFTKKMDALPGVNLMDRSYQDAFGEIVKLYDNMTDAQKKYMESYAPLYLSNYKLYLDKMNDMGISYESTVEKEITMDDLLSAFNKKMDELMTKMSNLSVGGSSQAPSPAQNSSNEDNTPSTSPQGEIDKNPEENVPQETASENDHKEETATDESGKEENNISENVTTRNVIAENDNSENDNSENDNSEDNNSEITDSEVL